MAAFPARTLHCWYRAASAVRMSGVEGSILDRLLERLPDVDIHVIPERADKRD